MSYFDRFPSMLYDISKPGVTEPKVVVTKDIIRRVKLRSNIADNIFSYDPYDIKDGERPDIVADAYYGNVNYVWLIFLANDIVDPYYDWPLTTNQFEQFIIDKYGSIEASKDTTSTTNIIHYKHNTKDTIISKDTYDMGACLLYTSPSPRD